MLDLKVLQTILPPRFYMGKTTHVDMHVKVTLVDKVGKYRFFIQDFLSADFIFVLSLLRPQVAATTKNYEM